MPVDPMIARGFNIPDPANALLLAEQMNSRRQQNALMQQQFGFRQQQFDAEQRQMADEQAKAQEEQEMRMLYPAVKAGDPQAIAAVQERIAKRNPGLASVIGQDPGRLAAMLAQGLGIQEPEAPKPPQLYQTEQGFLPADQAVGKMPYRAPPQPQQYGPNRDIETMRYVMSLPPEQRESALAALGRGPKGGPVATGPGGAGLNDRQVAGMNMQKANAIMYAANLTGLPREEVERIFATEGPEGIERIMLEKGERWIQGGVARAVQGIPFVGKGIVEATNADLIAPAKGGGAGIALVQNPTGPVATADFQAGEAQFPNAMYPLKTQAAMVRQMLSDGQQMAGQQPEQRINASDLPPPAALRQLQEGKVTTFANGERWTVQNGKAVRVQ